MRQRRILDHENHAPTILSSFNIYSGCKHYSSSSSSLLENEMISVFPYSLPQLLSLYSFLILSIRFLLDGDRGNPASCYKWYLPLRVSLHGMRFDSPSECRIPPISFPIYILMSYPIPLEILARQEESLRWFQCCHQIEQSMDTVHLKPLRLQSNRWTSDIQFFVHYSTRGRMYWQQDCNVDGQEAQMQWAVSGLVAMKGWYTVCLEASPSPCVILGYLFEADIIEIMQAHQKV